MKVNVVTVACHCERHLNGLLESCRRLGFTPCVLGMGKPFRGYGYRLKLIREHILANCSKRDLIVHCDAFDTLFAKDLASIAAEFRTLGAPILFSAEKHCWPDQAKAKEYPQGETPYRFLCAGGWMGYAGAVLEIFDLLKLDRLPDNADDQREFTRLYLSGTSFLHLDCHCRVFQTLYDALDDLNFGDAIENLKTRSTPMIFHGQGLSDMSKVLRFLRIE